MARKKSAKSKKAKAKDEHGLGSVNEQLDSVFEESWEGVDAYTFDETPDGSYPSKLVGANINNAKSSGRLQCSWEWIIVSGDNKGRHIFIHQGLNTEDALAYFKGSLARLGYEEPSTKKKLLATLEEMVEGPTYAVVRLATKKKKNSDGDMVEQQNSRIIKALDSDEVEDELDEDAVATEDSVEPDAEETEAESEEEGEDWAKGDRCVVDIDGKDYPGKIKKLKGDDDALVKFDDGDEQEIALDDLKEEEAEETEEEPEAEAEEEETEEEPEAEAEEEEAEEEGEAWAKGDRCLVDIDGKDYAGKITKIDDENANVTFDDGDKQVIDIDDLKEEEAEEEAEEEGEEEEEVPPCELKSKKLSSAEVKETNKLAKEYSFAPDDFDSSAKLLCEIGDYSGLSGKFKNPAALLKAIKAAIEED